MRVGSCEPETFAATKAWVAGEDLPAATIQTDSSKLTRRKRKVTANAREEAKEARRLERREAKRAEIKEDLMTGRYSRWRDFSRKWNLARYFDKTERDSLKEIFHCKNSEMGSAAELSSKS